MLLFYALLIALHLSNGKTISSQAKADYDMLIFTQEWPPTNCFEWREKSPSNQCNFPKEEWSIHGLWPSKNHSMGPFFCNSSMHFDFNALRPLIDRLKDKWMDVHKGSKPQTFWRHEWEKHGTCSADLESLNSEKKYFSKALELIDKYEMNNVLGKVQILPNATYFVQDFLNGVYKILGKNAYVECVKDKKTNSNYIAEIRICLNKALELIDCNGIVHFPSNCKLTDKINYPGITPILSNHPTVIQL